MKKWLVFFSLVYLLFPKPAFAHAFGRLYNLPVPFWLYLYGGAAALIASFIVIGYFINKRNASLTYPVAEIPINVSRFFNPTKIISILLLLLTIITGLIGIDISFLNFNMTFFWIIFMLGFTYLTSLIGNMWDTVNPWKTLAQWFEKIANADQTKGIIMYPKSFGYYPALILYFLFIWLELFGNTSPASLSIVLIQYTFINFAGIILIGKENWFKYCEFLSVFFHLIGKISFIENRKGKFYLRPPFVGLLKESAEHFSLVIFILFMLSSTAFDGLRETTVWYSLPYEISPTLALFLSPFIFLAIYLVAICLVKILTASKISILELALKFAFSLIPIALVYNIAHYYTLLLMQGQEIIRLISDPFGFNWNLFGTAKYVSNIGIVDAGFVWHSQVFFILLGHIAGVYLAHVIALNIFSLHKKALISQLPMLILMVVYTVIGLWILSQPIL